MAQTTSNGGAKVWQDEERHFNQICRVEFNLDNEDVHDLMGRAYGAQMRANHRKQYKVGNIRDEWTQRFKESKPYKLWHYICQTPGSGANPFSGPDLGLRDRLRDDIVRVAAQTGGSNWLLEDGRGRLTRPILAIPLSPAPGSLAAAALARAPAHIQGAVAAAGHGHGLIAPPLPAPAPIAPAPIAPAPIAPVPAAPLPVPAPVAQPATAQDEDDSESEEDQDDVETHQFDTAAYIEAIQDVLEENPATKDHTAVNAIKNMLHDDTIDDDAVIAHTNHKAVMATYTLVPLPMVHQKDITWGGPKGARYFTTVNRHFAPVDVGSRVYQWGGAAVKLRYEDGVSTDAMVCSVDVCKHPECYPDASESRMPAHTPRPHAGKPFVHVKRDCDEVDGDLFFVGNAHDLPWSRWNELPLQVQDMPVWFEVDGKLQKTVAQGCVVERCFACKNLP